MRLSIIVPCFNEEGCIDPFYREVCRVLVEEPCIDFEAEIIFIDDGSQDATLKRVKGLAAADSRVRYLAFSRNFGKEAAIFAGLEHASGDYVAIMDADLQDPPQMLPILLEAVSSKDASGGSCDIARIRRSDRKGEPRVRSWFAQRFYRMMNAVSDIEIVDGARDYQVMSRSVVDAMLAMRERNRFFKGISSWVGFRTSWFEYKNAERVAGESSWSFWGLMRYAIEGITAFSTTPLLIASVAGIFCFGIAMLAVIFIAIRTLLFGDPVSGWPSMICVILLVGGIQLFCIGILGQYLSRTYLEVKKRPLYVMRDSNF